ncbi:beta-galactosidase [Pricia sp.]|uniref:beta-galactosidase n=1 Tax=Pricia sp. TaxID=2268138 RepID=UPI00359491EC
MSLAVVLVCWMSGYGQQIEPGHHYSIDIDIPEKQIVSELDLGGTNNKGETIAANNYYLSQNAKPIIPITGEFHFSRYPEEYWEEAIQKMKAGGINMMATYVFWILHEEEEGIFDFEGNKNVRKFVELCAQYDLPVIIRIGPFGHGEVRNGALPDWLLAKPLTVRSNDPDYLFYAERLYNKIGKQLKGLFFKDGGPIIATQIENEYQHSAAPWGLTYPGQPLDYTASERDKALTQKGVGVSKEDNPYAALGNDHMKLLKSLAQKAGIETPLYTATGWRNAAIIPNESLPVTAAYAYPTWTDERELSPFYLYTDMHKNPDYAPVRYTPESYPAFAAELGGGIMATYDRRPVVLPESLDALINRCLGSGANGIGYYMYHGGSTPRGKHNFLNDEAIGAAKISYDFQAPIGEFGQTRASYHRLKLIHYFLNAFADRLAPMTTVLPETNTAIQPSNTETLRYAVRHEDDSGFLFINNFQDHKSPTDKEAIQIQVNTSEGIRSIPENGGFDIKSSENAIFPFNFDLSGVHLNYATAQLLTASEDKKNPYYVFFAPEGVRPQFSFKKAKGLKIVNGSHATITSNKERWLVDCPQDEPSEFILKNESQSIKVLVVDKNFALKSWPVDIDQREHLLFTDADVLQHDQGLELLSKEANTFEFFVYPKTATKLTVDGGNLSAEPKNKVLSHFKVAMPEASLLFNACKINDKRLVVSLEGGIPENLHDVILKIDYIGDTAMGFLDNELVADEFYKGIPWEIGLRYFSNIKKAKEMNFYFRPIYKDAPFLVDLEENQSPDFSERSSFVEIRKTDLIPVYRSVLNFKD